ncbi:MAG: histidine--tRNA ligase [Candidatus Micrarchaeia archaeon]
MAASFQPPRGMRDFLPKEMIAREEMLEKITAVFRAFGFEPLETPALESMEVLRAKAGDVSGQIFPIEGGELGLRFDLTVPLARVVAGNPALPKPFKRYCIARVWRREEPQKGRLREFLQADIDIVGSAEKSCEAELLACASKALEATGFDEYRIRLNNRRILERVLAGQGIEAGVFSAVMRSLDKTEKIGDDGVVKELEAKGVSGETARALLRALRMGGGNAEKLARMGEIAGEGVRELRDILELAKAYGIEKRIQVDFLLVRGLDYYTGPVFEIDAGGGVGSIAGGGRYDNLIQAYGGEPTPAVGISLGVERMMALRAGEGKSTRTRVFVANAKPEFLAKAVAVAQSLRERGITAQADVMGRNLRRQFEWATGAGIPFIAVVGEREVKEKKITLRDLAKREERMVTLAEAAKILRERK